MLDLEDFKLSLFLSCHLPAKIYSPVLELFAVNCVSESLTYSSITNVKLSSSLIISFPIFLVTEPIPDFDKSVNSSMKFIFNVTGFDLKNGKKTITGKNKKLVDFAAVVFDTFLYYRLL